MRTTEQVYRWEVDGLARRLEALEDRLRRRDQDRLQALALGFWMLWAAAISAMVMAAALT
jgi:hypothetical protein